MNRRRSHIRRPAFTLMELLVVVAMLSVLLAVLLPALQRARTVARRTACAVQLQKIALALLLYVEENQGKFSLRGYGANPEFEYGGWPGSHFATYRPVNPNVRLPAKAATRAEARCFQCPADSGDVNVPVPFYEDHGNSYKMNTALGCSSGIPESVDDTWRPIHVAVNLRLKGLRYPNVPGATILVGDNNWLGQIDPKWEPCAKAWHGRLHSYNLAFLDNHVAHVHIRKGIYLEQSVYDWQPFADLDSEVLQRQKQVPCSCGRE